MYIVRMVTVCVMCIHSTVGREMRRDKRMLNFSVKNETRTPEHELLELCTVMASDVSEMCSVSKM